MWRKAEFKLYSKKVRKNWIRIIFSESGIFFFDIQKNGQVVISFCTPLHSNPLMQSALWVDLRLMHSSRTIEHWSLWNNCWKPKMKRKSWKQKKSLIWRNNVEEDRKQWFGIFKVLEKKTQSTFFKRKNDYRFIRTWKCMRAQEHCKA